MTRPLASGLLFAVVAVAVTAGGLSAADITLLSGKTSKGTLVGVDAKFASVKDGADTVKIPTTDLAVVDFGVRPVALPPGTKFDEIELLDGSILRHTEFKLKKKAVEIALLPAGSAPMPELDLAMSSVFYVCRDAHDLTSRERFKKRLGERKKRDMLLTVGDGLLDVVEGTILEGTEAGTSVVFVRAENDDKVTWLLATRASGGLIFNQPPPAVVPPTVCKVFDVFGNVLYAQAVTVEGTALTVKTVSGATVKYKSLESVSKMDFASGNVTYLSDLDAGVTAPPAAPDEPSVPFLKDKVYGNTPLRLAGRVYAKGLWVNPDTTLTYKLGGDYREFKAVVGIDDEGRDSGGNSKAFLVVTADGRELLRQAFDRKAAAKEVVLNVKDVKELKISLSRESLFTGSHLNLADARLQK